MIPDWNTSHYVVYLNHLIQYSLDLHSPKKKCPDSTMETVSISTSASGYVDRLKLTALGYEYKGAGIGFTLKHTLSSLFGASTHQQWKIVACNNAFCTSEQVNQPFVLLAGSANGCCNILSLYKLSRDLNSLSQVFVVDESAGGGHLLNLMEDGSALYIVDSNCLLCINNCKHQLSCVLKDQSSQKFYFAQYAVPISLKCHSLVSTNKSNGNYTMNFLAPCHGFIENKTFSKNNAADTIKMESSSQHVIDNNHFKDFKWTKMNVLLSFNDGVLKLEIDIVLETVIPDAFCQIASAIHCFNEPTEGKATARYLIATSQSQIYLIKNEKHLKCAKLPLQSPDEIFIRRQDESVLAIVFDRSNRKACALDVSTLKVVDSWENVSTVVSPGALLLNEEVCEAVVVIHNLPTSETSYCHQGRITSDHCTVLSSLRDAVLAGDTKRTRYDNLTEVGKSFEDIEDLFAESSEETCDVDGLRKVRHSLACLVDKHKSWLASLSTSWNQLEDFGETTLQRLKKMNRNLCITEGCGEQQRRTDDLVDLFTGQPVCKVAAHQTQTSRIFQIERRWRRTCDKHYLVGFRVKNLSSRRFSRCCAIVNYDDDDAQPTKKSRATAYTRATRTKCFALRSAHDDADFRAWVRDPPRADAIRPHQSFAVVLILAVPWSDGGLSESRVSYNVSLAVHDDGGGGQCFFPVGPVDISACDAAASTSLIDVSRTGDLLEDWSCLMSIHNHRSTYRLFSSILHVQTTCQKVFDALGFRLSSRVGCFVCTNGGLFHMTVVDMSNNTNVEEVTVTISSRLASEAEMLISCLREKLPGLEVDDDCDDVVKQKSDRILPEDGLRVTNDDVMEQEREFEAGDDDDLDTRISAKRAVEHLLQSNYRDMQS